MGCLITKQTQNVVEINKGSKQKNQRYKKNQLLPKTSTAELQQQKQQQNKKIMNQIKTQSNHKLIQLNQKPQIKNKKLSINQTLKIDHLSSKIQSNHSENLIQIPLNLNQIKKSTRESVEAKAFELIQTIQESPLINLKNQNNNNIITKNQISKPLSLIPEKQIAYSTIIQQNFNEGDSIGTKFSAIIHTKPLSVSLDFKNEFFLKKIQIPSKMTDNMRTNNFPKKNSNNKNIKSLNSLDLSFTYKNPVMKIDQSPLESERSSKKGIKIIKKDQSLIKKSNLPLIDIDQQNKHKFINNKFKFIKLLDNYTNYLKQKYKGMFGLIQFFKIPYKQLALHYLLENIINLKSMQKKFIFQKIKQNLVEVLKYILNEYKTHLTNNNILFMNQTKQDKDEQNMIKFVFYLKNERLGIYESKVEYWKTVVTCFDDFFLHYY